MEVIGLMIVGLFAGAVSGVTGIGGGAVIVPALIYIFGYPLRVAEGTTLALLLPPIGAFAAWNYYQRGYVAITAAIIIALGFMIGSEFSSHFLLDLPEGVARKVFALTLGFIAIKMFFGE